MFSLSLSLSSVLISRSRSLLHNTLFPLSGVIFNPRLSVTDGNCRKKRITRRRIDHREAFLKPRSHVPRYVHLSEANEKNWWTAVFGRVWRKTMLGMPVLPTYVASRRGESAAQSGAEQSQRNLLPFIHHCRHRLPSASRAWISQVREPLFYPHEQNTSTGSTRLEERHVNRESWRLNAKATASWNVRMIFIPLRVSLEENCTHVSTSLCLIFIN